MRLLTISVVLDERQASPALAYLATEVLKHLSRVPGAQVEHVSILRTSSVGRVATSQLNAGERAWNAFDARVVGLSAVEQPPGLPPGVLVEELDSVEQLKFSSDLVFVHSADPAVLARASRSGRRGALELRQGSRPVAASPRLGWREVSASLPTLGLELVHSQVGRESAFGPWEVRVDRASPARTVKALADGSALLLELGLAALERGKGFSSQGTEVGVSGKTGAASLWSSFVWRKLEGRMRHLARGNSQWGIGLLSNAKPGVGPVAFESRRVRWYAPNKELFWADPFLFTEAGKTYVLFEELPFNTWRGHLRAAELSADSGMIESQTILRKSFHLSFPFCFRHEDGIYLLPEQAESGRVQLYRAKHFPEQWEEGPVLLPDFPGIDNVLLAHGGRWWLFTTSGRDGNHDNHLMLFHAPSPFGPFEPHPENPICLGLSGSRMAGAIIANAGRLFRPGQDCSRRYGGALVFFEIETLDPHRYRERKVTEIRPDPSSLFSEALHSWSQTDAGLLAVDGLRLLPRFGATRVVESPNDLG